jgi:capsular exopolysaccharide synthesis family protein
MSRIHEALKKAELERAAAQNGGGGSAPSEPQAIAQNGTGNGVASTAGRESKAAVVAEAGSPFGFDELQSRRRADLAWNPDASTDVFNPFHGGNGAEQFRTLRSRLYQLRSSQPLRTLLVTSSVAGEGKTFVTSNLVRAIVRQVERRVLVIDADLRCPRLHTVLGAPAAPGLSDYLRGASDEPSVIQHGGSGNLCFIPSGSRVSDPSELLLNGRFKKLLERVGPAFDWVVIDSPPCLPVADSGMIAEWCDGVLLVVRAGFTPSGVIQKSRHELKRRNVVGVVLNAAAHDALGYGSYYASGYQGAEAQAAR